MSVYIREKETGLIGMLLQLWFTMSLTLVKPSRCVLLKDTSDSYCVYKNNDAVLASFLLAVVMVTIRRQELHRGFYVGITSQFMLLVLYRYNCIVIIVSL